MTAKRGLITDSFKMVKKARREGKREKRPAPPSPPPPPRPQNGEEQHSVCSLPLELIKNYWSGELL